MAMAAMTKVEDTLMRICSLEVSTLMKNFLKLYLDKNNSFPLNFLHSFASLKFLFSA